MTVSTTSRPLVAVFGSTNLDVALRVDRLPRPGETVVASGFAVGPGGKGANQAAAASRAGVATALLSAVGADEAASQLLEVLTAIGVDTSRMLIEADGITGRAHIAVDGSGENSIVIAGGANAALSEDYADRVADVIAAAAVLVTQGEAPADATRAAIRVAQHHGTRVVANLAPYIDLGVPLSEDDVVVVNELEASALAEAPVRDVDSVRALSGRLQRSSAAAVVVTLGPTGAALCHAGRIVELPARAPDAVVDTTGSGDAFVGVLAAALASGIDLETACRAAVEAATRSVETVGAAASYPAFDLPIAAAVIA